ncbi:hypothetical protein TNCV_5095201 [Trichonephila clavipes]|nr:hypothetical protein TNCV_5095201 [Trichonephila clavipes]
MNFKIKKGTNAKNLTLIKRIDVNTENMSVSIPQNIPLQFRVSENNSNSDLYLAFGRIFEHKLESSGPSKEELSASENNKHFEFQRVVKKETNDNVRSNKFSKNKSVLQWPTYTDFNRKKSLLFAVLGLFLFSSLIIIYFVHLRRDPSSMKNLNQTYRYVSKEEVFENGNINSSI